MADGDRDDTFQDLGDGFDELSESNGASDSPEAGGVGVWDPALEGTVADRRMGLERHRGPGRRRSDFLKAAEEGELTTEQYLFLAAIDVLVCVVVDVELDVVVPTPAGRSSSWKIALDGALVDAQPAVDAGVGVDVELLRGVVVGSSLVGWMQSTGQTSTQACPWSRCRARR
jgi:hypothetical protein